MDQPDRVITEERVRAASEREVVLHVAGCLLRVQAGDRVADRDPLIQRDERGLPELAPQRRLPEQQQAERGGLVHPHVRQAADPLKALGIQEVGFVDDDHDLLAALGALGRQQLLGLGDQRGVMKPRGAAQCGDDQPVDPAQPHPGGAEIEHRVPGGVQSGDRRPGSDRLPRPALARDHADRLLRDAPLDPGDRLRVRAMGVQHPGREVLPNGIRENP